MILTVTATIMCFWSLDAVLSKFRMIFSDKVVLTCFEHRYAPMNSNTEPRINYILM